MNKKFTKAQLLNKKIANYTFLIAFFLLFAFFIFVAIKPNLEIAFKLKKELVELKALDNEYNNAINQIIDIQSIMVAHRDDLPLLQEALPNSPEINKLFLDIQSTASSSGFPISNLAINQVPLQNGSADKKMKNYKVTFQSTANFDGVHNFLNTFLSRRRLKMIDKLNINKPESESSASASLKVGFEIQGYYL